MARNKPYVLWLGIVIGVCICLLIVTYFSYESFATPAAPAAPAAPTGAAAPAARAAPPAERPKPVSDAEQNALQTIHTSIPLMDMKLTNTLKTMLNNIIVQRPDVIQAINYVLSDPQIHKTLVETLFILKQQ
jgi:3-oxoacyl-ACP reductase-like protein